ncbi:MetQ/NlpA family ABC transporter substrate-binding protein [Corallococcus exiguus]|uniref:MetQ/NlpA family ABC transporter substrate-binding protein n=1 Tax=Corallococcus exiguus TaxID=83462 RepID=UPI001494ED79|nr:MetQ/NlpA family ABC transporter substrate-binding protein [Corallococcus exiguus]NPC69190.1 MetQ/NlpA family ABC transporter substrate-binding protein [Corallococcus exiguus]
MRTSFQVLSASLLLLATSLLGACKPAPSESANEPRPLKVGVNPVPHGEILRVAAKVAERAGVRVEVVEFTDYIQPNLALADGQLDANYFQHEPYLERFAGERHLALKSVGAVHLEPLALYSLRFRQLAELPQGAKLSLPADPSNAARALHLLAKQGLLTLREGAGADATLQDVVGNPRKLDLKEIDAEQQPRTLEDVDGAVINGNYFLEAQKQLHLDAHVLARESATRNPHANVLAVRTGDEARPEIRALVKALQSDEVRRYIDATYSGAVIPAF